MKPLKRIQKKCWYFVDGKKIEGTHQKIRGDVSDIWGDVSGIWGDASGIWGNVSGIRGDVSGIWGNFNEIPMEDRKDKPNVSEWVDDIGKDG